MGLCFAIFVFLTFRGPLASHDSNPYPNRSRIARYNATKLLNSGGSLESRISLESLGPASSQSCSNETTSGAHQGRRATRLPRRVLRRVLETAFEKVLRRVLRRCLAVCFRWRKGSEKGS